MLLATALLFISIWILEVVYFYKISVVEEEEYQKRLARRDANYGSATYSGGGSGGNIIFVAGNAGQ